MNHKNLSVITISISTCLLQAGCGGGGTGIQPATVPFTSFNAIQADQNVVAEGISQTATVTLDTSTGEDKVTNAPPATVADTENTQLTLGFDSSSVQNALTIEAPATKLSWSESNGDSFIDVDGSLVVSNPAGTQGFVAVGSDETALSWNFQTFGIWQDISVSGTIITDRIGVVSAGSASPVSHIPTSGNATYTGLTAGFYSNAEGTPHAFGSTLTANADFKNRNINFVTSDTTIVTVDDTSAVTLVPGLNLNGSLSYIATSNQFSGKLTSKSGSLSGTATGRFYGPDAEEIGGTFGLSGSGVESMLGGFGAKRPKP